MMPDPPKSLGAVELAIDANQLPKLQCLAPDPLPTHEPLVALWCNPMDEGSTGTLYLRAPGARHFGFAIYKPYCFSNALADQLGHLIAKEFGVNQVYLLHEVTTWIASWFAVWADMYYVANQTYPKLDLGDAQTLISEEVGLALTCWASETQAALYTPCAAFKPMEATPNV